MMRASRESAGQEGSAMKIVKIKQKKGKPNWFLYWTEGYKPKFRTTRFPVAMYPDPSKVKELEVLRARTQTQLNEGIFLKDRPGPKLTFSEVLAQFKADPVLRVTEKATYKDKISSRLNCLEREFGPRLIRDLNHEVIAKWFNSFRKPVDDQAEHREVPNAWNILSYRNYLNQVFAYALKKRFISENPITEILDRNQKFFPVQPSGRIVHLTPEQIGVMYEAMDELEATQKSSHLPMSLFRDIFEFREFTGTRTCEALRLKVGDILENSTLYIRAGKTAYGRHLPLTPYVHELLNRNAQGKRPENRVFTWGKKALTTENLRSSFERIRAVASKRIPELAKVHFYDLRHVAITRLAERGIGESLIASLAGHRSTRTTQIYINLAVQQLTPAALALEAYRRPPAETPAKVLPIFYPARKTLAESTEKVDAS